MLKHTNLRTRNAVFLSFASLILLSSSFFLSFVFLFFVFFVFLGILHKTSWCRFQAPSCRVYLWEKAGWFVTHCPNKGSFHHHGFQKDSQGVERSSKGSPYIMQCRCRPLALKSLTNFLLVFCFEFCCCCCCVFSFRGGGGAGGVWLCMY